MPNTTAPPIAVGANTALMYVNDAAAGNAAFHFKTELGHVIKLYRPNAGSPYTITNATPSRSIDASSYTMDQVVNLVAALINDLTPLGLIE